MSLYLNPTRFDTEDIDAHENGILLRSDIHTIFDQKRFALVPKPSSTTPTIWSFVAHLTTPGSCQELAMLYHNVMLQPLTGIAIEFLLARFAWTIFGNSKYFLLRRVKRVLCLAEDGQTKIRELSGDECKALRQARAKSGSPKKRKPATQEGQQDEEGEQEDEEEEQEDEEGRGGDEEGQEDEEPRSRKRRRSFLTTSKLVSSFEKTPWDINISDSDTDTDHSEAESYDVAGTKRFCIRTTTQHLNLGTVY